MKETEPTRRLEAPTMGKFKAFVRKVISVPKKEVEKEREAYRQKRKQQ